MSHTALHPCMQFIFQVIEPNEELHLELFKMFNCPVHTILVAGGANITNPHMEWIKLEIATFKVGGQMTDR